MDHKLSHCFLYVTDQAYGVRDCAFRDPSGNHIRFSEPLPEAGRYSRDIIATASRSRST